jgi:hypothetical protein
MKKEDNSLSDRTEDLSKKEINDNLVVKKKFFSNTLILSLIFIFIFGSVIAFVFYNGYFNKNPDLGDNTPIKDNATDIELVDNTNDSIGYINNSNKPVNASNVKKSSTIVSGGSSPSGGSGDTGGGTIPTPTCTPSCSGKTCGDDGCSGSCGTCDDSNECTIESCDLGICNYTKVLDNTLCSDGTCQNGSCISKCINGEGINSTCFCGEIIYDSGNCCNNVWGDEICPVICDATNSCYYVDSVNGNDSNNGSFEYPWKTLSNNSIKLNPGDTLYAMSGIYNEQLKVKTSGSPDNWITYQAYPGEEVIIDGYGLYLNWQGLVQIQNKSYIRIKGLKIRTARTPGKSGAGVFVNSNSHHIEILNNTISNTSMSGIIVGTGYTSDDELNSYITVKGNELFETNHLISQEALSFCNVDHFEISYNHVHDTYKEGIDVKCSSSNGIIHHNKVHDLPGSGIYLDANPIVNVSIYSNYVYNQRSLGKSEEVSFPYFYNWLPGIALNSEPGSTMDYINIYNNIVDNVSYYSFSIGNSNNHPTTRISHVNIYNNIFERSYCSGCSNIVISIQSGSIEDIEIWNNILWRRIQYDGWGKAISLGVGPQYDNISIHNNLYEYFNSWNNVTGTVDGPFYGTDNVILAKGKNVSFVVDGDPVLGEEDSYKVDLDSSSIDNGSFADLDVDYYGNFRPHGNGYDIGAYEYQGVLATQDIFESDINGNSEEIDSNVTPWTAIADWFKRIFNIE